MQSHTFDQISSDGQWLPNILKLYVIWSLSDNRQPPTCLCTSFNFHCDYISFQDGPLRRNRTNRTVRLEQPGQPGQTKQKEQRKDRQERHDWHLNYAFQCTCVAGQLSQFLSRYLFTFRQSCYSYCDFLVWLPKIIFPNTWGANMAAG